MSSIEAALIKENARLKEQFSEERAYLKEQLSEFEKVNLRQQSTIAALQQRVKEYIRRIYGRRSEKIDPSQMVFDDIILAAEKCLKPDDPAPHPEIVEEKVRAHIRRKHPGRKPLPPELERVEHYLDVPEEEKVTADGKERPIIGVDITEKLDYRPCVFVVNRYIRPKYGADDDIEGTGVKQHPPSAGAIDKCLAESGLLAHVIVEKYEHHVPLYRQELKFERLGIDITRQTMAGWNAGCAQALKPLWERMREEILAYDIVLNDDTPVDMLDPGSGQTRTTRLWCTVGGENLKYTMYNFTVSRGRDGPLEFFKEYRGHFVCDDYSGYGELFRSAPQVVYVSCWSHARRYFVEAQDTSPRAATEILTLIARLYTIEKDFKHSSAHERREARHQKATRVLKKIRRWLLENQAAGAYLPQSPMGKAIAHALKIWPNLCTYLRDGRIPIDNNLAENAIRPVALGRKNWLFFGSETGGQTAAILMTFTATCRKFKINTWEYLKDVLQRINTCPMSKIDDLLPDRWQHLRQAPA